MKLDLIREHYFQEQSRRLALDSATGFPVTLLAALGGLAAYYVQIFPVPRTPWNVPFFIFISMGVILLVAAFVFVVLSFARHRDLDLAAVRDWLDHHQQLKDYADAVEDDVDVDGELEDSLTLRYAEAVDRNSAGNIQRMAYLYRAKVFVALAAFSLSLCAFPYFAIKSQKADIIHNVKIVPSSPSATP